MAEPDKGSYPSTYTLSSGAAAKAELRELREERDRLAAVAYGAMVATRSALDWIDKLERDHGYDLHDIHATIIHVAYPECEALIRSRHEALRHGY